MKTTNKQLRKTVKIISFVLLANLLLISCKKEEPTCGCDSETLSTIPESANLIGVISYKIQLDPNDTYYNNKFWIGYTSQGCTNCYRMIVCNEEILGNEFNDIKVSGEIVEIKFSGHLKEVCEKTFDVAEHSYRRIVLTSIERQ